MIPPNKDVVDELRQEVKKLREEIALLKQTRYIKETIIIRPTNPSPLPYEPDPYGTGYPYRPPPPIWC